MPSFITIWLTAEALQRGTIPNFLQEKLLLASAALAVGSAKRYSLPSPKSVPFCLEQTLLDLALKVLALDQLGNVVIILIALLSLLHVLVALSELSEGSQGVGAELVENAGHKLRELLVLTVAVDGESVGGDSGVDYIHVSRQ